MLCYVSKNIWNNWKKEKRRTAQLFSCQRKVEKSCLGFKKSVERQQRNKDGCDGEKHAFANCGGKGRCNLKDRMKLDLNKMF